MANRHDVIIWDADVYGAPDGFSEYTYEKAYALIKQPAEPSKKLLAFARDVEKLSQSNDIPPVVAQYLVGFEDDIKAEGMAAYCFNLPEYNWQSIVKILLKEAIKHGLALFDEQIILVLLPNGTILPENSRKSWLQILNAPKQKNAFPKTLIELSQLFKADIGELLANHDFVLDAESSEYDEIGFSYVRQTSSVNHKIGFGYAGGNGQFELGYSIQLAENTMIEIGHKSDFQYYGDGGILLNIPSLIMNKSRFSIDSWESYEQFKTILKRSALTWSDTALDIKGLDALLNGNVDNRVKQEVHQFTYMPYALIVARLADNPYFEELAVSLGRWGVNSNTSWPAGVKTPLEIAWPKLVNYLRDEVKPLVSNKNKSVLVVTDSDLILETVETNHQEIEQNTFNIFDVINTDELEKNFPKTLTTFNDLISRAIGSLLKSYGFIFNSNSYCDNRYSIRHLKLYDDGRSLHAINITIKEDDKNYFHVDAHLEIHNRVMESIINYYSDFDFKLWQEGNRVDNWQAGGLVLELARILYPQQNSLIILDKQSLINFLSILEQSVLLWSNAALNIKGIDALLNGDIDVNVKKFIQQFVYMPYALIAARLANNPLFEDLAINLAPTEHDSKIWRGKGKIDPFVAWPKLVEFLREEEKTIASLINTKLTTPQKTKELPPAIKESLNQYLQEHTALDWPREYTFTFWLIQDDEALFDLLMELMNCMVFKILDKAEEAWQEANNPDGLEEDETAIALREKAELAKFPPIYAAIYRIMESIYSCHSPYEMYFNLLAWGKDGVAQLTEGLNLLGLTQLADAYTTVNNSIPPYDPDEDLDKKICAQQFLSAFESVMEYDNTQQFADIAEAIRKNYHLFLV
ncbi:MAG TPA: hypothetical protein PLF28_06195 [Agitococcus sp.]|nr:hypothetical protein [Agitococcus sp.]HMV60712.1 hypothetical protein [Agitococcus sp.]HMX99508.1 hypothetical protein [Agitococcus sp.]HMY28403.1 hypothetical protein [Agitococcus sp.]HNB19950.1 hypothetical protein [Agitococcus sp.]